MSYDREIPRDLFNEANLLKCYGQLYINLETACVYDAHLDHIDGKAFEIKQDPNDDGCLYISNVVLMVRGEPQILASPMNSLNPWPLYIDVNVWESISVFNDDGSFTSEMIQYLRG